MVYFEPFKNEIETLIEFMVSETWYFHGTTNSDPKRIRSAYENGYYTNEGCLTLWINTEEHKKIGYVRIYDLDDGAPLFDIRISSDYKKKGLGTQTVQLMVDTIFNDYPEINRIEGDTRQDNFAMRCVFSKCGFVKESHHRNAWECRNGDVYDSVGYGITREDWLQKKTTPLDWHDFKF